MIWPNVQLDKASAVKLTQLYRFKAVLGLTILACLWIAMLNQRRLGLGFIQIIAKGIVMQFCLNTLIQHI